MQITRALPEPAIPIPANIAAVWGGFLFEGLFVKTESSMRIVEVLAAWNYGCIELVTSASTLLPELWRQITVRWNDEDADFPGVFEYDVVAVLGAWLGDYLLAHGGAMPDPAEVSTQIRELIEAFFAQGLERLQPAPPVEAA